MNKKLWNYTFSILLSAILLLLLGVFIHLDSNNRVNGKPLGPGVISEDTNIPEEDIQDKEVPFLFEIYEEQEDDQQLFHKFIENRKKDLIDKPKVAIIIDDLGYQKEIAERILNMDFPVAISVLPFLSHSQLVAQMAKDKGMTVLLHLPMEPHNSDVNPGQGAIFSTMSEEDIRNKVSSNLFNLPNIDGINNHMGSKVTENEEIMRIVLTEIKKRGMFFVDSMTSPNSVGYKLCKEMGIKTAYRSVFLDNEKDLDYIRNQVKLLKEDAIRNGSAIAIGHPYCNTVDVLYEMDSLLQSEGIEIVNLKELLE
jgi:uncharacterized protein